MAGVSVTGAAVVCVATTGWKPESAGISCWVTGAVAVGSSVTDAVVAGSSVTDAVVSGASVTGGVAVGASVDDAVVSGSSVTGASVGASVTDTVMVGVSAMTGVVIASRAAAESRAAVVSCVGSPCVDVCSSEESVGVVMSVVCFGATPLGGVVVAMATCPEVAGEGRTVAMPPSARTFLCTKNRQNNIARIGRGVPCIRLSIFFSMILKRV